MKSYRSNPNAVRMHALAVVIVVAVVSATTVSWAGRSGGVGGYEYTVDVQGGGGISSVPANGPSSPIASETTPVVGVSDRPVDGPQAAIKFDISALNWVRLLVLGFQLGR